MHWACFDKVDELLSPYKPKLCSWVYCTQAVACRSLIKTINLAKHGAISDDANLCDFERCLICFAFKLVLNWHSFWDLTVKVVLNLALKLTPLVRSWLPYAFQMLSLAQDHIRLDWPSFRNFHLYQTWFLIHVDFMQAFFCNFALSFLYDHNIL